MEEFEARARESRVSDVDGFYESSRFKKGYELDRAQGVIKIRI